MDAKTKGIVKFANVLEKVIEQKASYSRLIAQSIDFELPKDIYDLVLTKMRPNMKITFIQDPWDLYNILKLKDTISFVKSPIYKEYIETEIFDSNIQIFTDEEIIPGEYVRDYSKIVLEYPPEMNITVSQVFSIDTSKTYRKCMVDEYNIMNKDENKVVEEETRLYVYVPDLLKFKEYYRRIGVIEKTRRNALNREFLKNLKKLYLYKQHFQKTLLSIDQFIPFELVEDVIKLCWDIGNNVKICQVSTPEKLSKIFIDFITQEPMTKVNIKNKNSTIVKYDTTNVLLKGAEEIPSLILLQGQTIEKMFEAEFDPCKPFVFKQYLDIDELITNSVTGESRIKNTFEISIYIYTPSDELVKEYKKRKLVERKKNI